MKRFCLSVLVLLLWVGSGNAAFITFSVNGATCSTPTNSVAPAVTPSSGSVGQLFTSTSGTWTGSPTFAYQWYQVDLSSPISGATSSTYTAVSGDVGHTLGSKIIATSGACSSSAVASNTTSTITSGGGAVAFSLPTGSVLHYMAPASAGGSDSNDGLAATAGGGHGPWISPNHSMNCGEVIIAVPGAYSANASTSTSSPGFGSVSNCPSTTGGIDGAGGIYYAVVLCGGTDLAPTGTTSCNITVTSSVYGAVDIRANHWAMEGWVVNGGGSLSRAFQCNATANGTIQYIYQAEINDIAYNSNFGFAINDGAINQNIPGNGCDYWSVVGDIAQNAAQDGICLAAIDAAGPSPFDSNPGTHILFYGNFAYAQVNTGCRTSFDTEDYMFDAWDAHDYQQQGVVWNNIGYDADRNCIELTDHEANVGSPSVKIYNNSCFQNNTHQADFVDGEINVGPTANGFSWITIIQNNITYQPLTAATGGGKVAAYTQDFSGAVSLTVGGSGSQNWFRANNSSCTLAFCNTTFDAESSQSVAALGTNTYTNPSFTNTTDLLANQIGAPNCSGFTNTTACMGWNANTSTLTTPSVISDLVPTAGGSASKGYQLPSTTCGSESTFTGSITGTTLTISGAAGTPVSIGEMVTGGTVSAATYITAGSGTSWTVNNSQSASATGATNYPLWLKGIVYLQWNGTSLTENADLVTKPCGL